MGYRLSNRHKQDSASPTGIAGIDLQTLAGVFFAFGFLGLLTAWIFSLETQKIFDDALPITASLGPPEIGPIEVKKRHEVYKISIRATIPVGGSSFIEGQVLDATKAYLFSFGKELWHERGRDAEGAWQEMVNTYSIDVTFPRKGDHYLRIVTAEGSPPPAIRLSVVRKRGSGLPHLWFGIVALVIGLILNEIRNRTIGGMLGAANS